MSTSNITLSPLEMVLGDEGAGLYVAKVFGLPHDVLDDIPLVEKPPLGMMYGKMCYQQRNVKFFARRKADGVDPGEFVTPGYRYSTQVMPSNDLTPELDELTDIVNTHFNDGYNAILMNRYVTGKDYLSAHADDESHLGSGGVVGIAFGDPGRIFRIRDSSKKKILYDISPLDLWSDEDEEVAQRERYAYLVWMEGDFQKHYTHEIPKRLRVKGSRTSITFRKHTS